MPKETMWEAEARMRRLIVKESYSDPIWTPSRVIDRLETVVLNDNCFVIRGPGNFATWVVTRETPESEWQKYKAN